MTGLVVVLVLLLAVEYVSHAITKRLVKAQRELLVARARLVEQQEHLIAVQREGIEIRDERIHLLEIRLFQVTP